MTAERSRRRRGLTSFLCTSFVLPSLVGGNEHEPPAVSGRLPLSLFKTILRTFVDDEISHPTTSDRSEQARATEVAVGAGVDSNVYEEALAAQLASVDNAEMLTRGIPLKNSDRRNRVLKRSAGDTKAEQSQSRVDPETEAQRVWDGLVSHAWDLAELVSTQHIDQHIDTKDRIEAGRGRRLNEVDSLVAGEEIIIASNAGAHFLDNQDIYDIVHEVHWNGGEVTEPDSWSHGIKLDEEEELELGWSAGTDAMFLVCSDSVVPMSGNNHLQEILVRSGKEPLYSDESDEDTLEDQTQLTVVYSSPNLVCVIMGLQTAYAQAIANETSVPGMQEGAEARDVVGNMSSITIVPWLDVMKISPDLFSHLQPSTDTRTSDPSDRRAAEVDEQLWEIDEQDRLEDKLVVFSLTSSRYILEDAIAIKNDLIQMAKNGKKQRRRRRMADNGSIKPRKHARGNLLRELSIEEALTVAQSSHHSSDKWSDILSRGLESSHDECVMFLIDAEMKQSSFKHSFEFPLLAYDASSNSTGPIPSAECIASIIVGISTHPNVLNVGLVQSVVNLHNHKAQWVVQGAVKRNNGSWRRPFFEAGLDGSGQVVSVSDTGLDVQNCYFQDERGVGLIHTQWDYSRRKVIKYDTSARGGDRSDTQKGHGTHVCGTIAGQHVLDGSIGDDSHRKEGVAPKAKLHFYDIGNGYTVNDPRGDWFENFHHTHAQRGAKIATGSWGFGYRTSYDWVCRLYDQLLVDYPDVLYISSSGNTGDKYSSPFNTVGAPASCKNVFAVGATNSAGFGSGLGYVVDFTSRGPSADGRIKPDILAPGYALDSALSFSTNCKVEEESYLKAGTSMAAPVIAGMGALVREYFQEGWYPCGSRYCGATLNPSGSLVKATIANGGQYTKGVQQGGTENIIKTQPVRPYDNNQGMGEANLLTTLPLKNENDFNLFVENDAKLVYGESKAYFLNIDKVGCSSDLSATIAWYDAVGTNGCQRCLINDIDLLVEKIVSPGMVKYYPNGRQSRDYMNTIERVRIDNASLGDKYKITVKARMLGPLSNEQAFSLAIRGCFTRVNKEDQASATKQEVPPEVKYELPITYSANRKQAGNMFGILAKVDNVEINSFAFQTLITGRTTSVHVFKLTAHGNVYGSENFLNNPAAWTRLSPTGGIQVQAKGFGNPTIIPAGSFTPISVAKGLVQSIYISLIEETEMLYKAVDKTHPTGAVYASDSNISVMTGVGKGISFGQNWQSRQMNGAVFYSVGGTGTIEATVPDQAPNPTRPPTKQPTNRPQSPILPQFSELETTYNANKKQAGNMFNIIAKKNVEVNSFKIHTLLKSITTATIYTKNGRWQSYDKDPSAWTKLGTVSLECKGYRQPTLISDSSMPSVSISQGDTRAFYITLDTPELLYFFSDSNASGSVFREDAAIKVETGVGKGGLFDATYPSRQLNGAVVYFTV